MERAMAVLTEAERAAIVQCYHNDLSHEEAAFVLGCPVGTVKTHIHRAKQKLKATLAAMGAPAGGRSRDDRRPHFAEHYPTTTARRRAAADARARSSYLDDRVYCPRDGRCPRPCHAALARRRSSRVECRGHRYRDGVPGRARRLPRSVPLLAAQPVPLPQIAAVLAAICVVTGAGRPGRCGPDWADLPISP
jgi:hypothetical protein